MWYPARITTAVTTEPVSLDQAKVQCAIEHDEQDGFLSRLITVAREHVEAYCSIRIAPCAIAVSADGFGDLARLSVAPVRSVTGISYFDVNGAEAVLASAVYDLRADDLEAAIVLKPGQVWPAIQPGSRITLTIAVGYDTAPAAVAHAILLLVADSYDNRGNEKVEDWTVVDSLLCNHRRGS